MARLICNRLADLSLYVHHRAFRMYCMLSLIADPRTEDLNGVSDN